MIGVPLGLFLLMLAWMIDNVFGGDWWLYIVALVFIGIGIGFAVKDRLMG